MKKVKINDELEVLFEMMPTDGVKFTNNTEKCVYAYMWFWSVDDRNVDGVFKMPMTALTNTLGICRKTASIMVASLVRKGCFEVVNKGSNLSKTASTYRFTLGLEKSIYTLNSNINRNRNFNSNRKGNDNCEININGNGRIGDVNNVSVTQTENDIELNYISTEKTVDAVETTNRNHFSSKLEYSVQPFAVDTINHQVENDIEQPAKTTISTPEDVCVVNNARSLVSEIEDKNSSTYATTISTTEETDDTVTPRSYFDIISSSPVATGIDIQQQTTFTSSTWVDIDDINDAKASLHSSRGSSTQDRITSLWVEIERGSDFESAYRELQGMFNAKVVTQRQWDLTERKYEKRKSSTSLVQNQKKEKEKKVCESTNKTLMHFPQEKMNDFNNIILKAYNACKTALNQERNEGKAFDEEKYIKAFEQYAFGLDKLCDETDEDGNRFGDYQYLKSKVWLKPFSPKSNDDTKAICDRYLSITAKKQYVVNV